MQNNYGPYPPAQEPRGNYGTDPSQQQYPRQGSQYSPGNNPQGYPQQAFTPAQQYAQQQPFAPQQGYSAQQPFGQQDMHQSAWPSQSYTTPFDPPGYVPTQVDPYSQQGYVQQGYAPAAQGMTGFDPYAQQSFQQSYMPQPYAPNTQQGYMPYGQQEQYGMPAGQPTQGFDPYGQQGYQPDYMPQGFEPNAQQGYAPVAPSQDFDTFIQQSYQPSPSTDFGGAGFDNAYQQYAQPYATPAAGGFSQQQFAPAQQGMNHPLQSASAEPAHAAAPQVTSETVFDMIENLGKAEQPTKSATKSVEQLLAEASNLHKAAQVFTVGEDNTTRPVDSSYFSGDKAPETKTEPTAAQETLPDEIATPVEPFLPDDTAINGLLQRAQEIKDRTLQEPLPSNEPLNASKNLFGDAPPLSSPQSEAAKQPEEHSFSDIEQLISEQTAETTEPQTAEQPEDIVELADQPYGQEESDSRIDPSELNALAQAVEQQTEVYKSFDNDVAQETEATQGNEGSFAQQATTNNTVEIDSTLQAENTQTAEHNSAIQDDLPTTDDGFSAQTEQPTFDIDFAQLAEVPQNDEGSFAQQATTNNTVEIDSTLQAENTQTAEHDSAIQNDLPTRDDGFSAQTEQPTFDTEPVQTDECAPEQASESAHVVPEVHKSTAAPVQADATRSATGPIDLSLFDNIAASLNKAEEIPEAPASEVSSLAAEIAAMQAFAPAGTVPEQKAFSEKTPLNGVLDNPEKQAAFAELFSSAPQPAAPAKASSAEPQGETDSPLLAYLPTAESGYTALDVENLSSAVCHISRDNTVSLMINELSFSVPKGAMCSFCSPRQYDCYTLLQTLGGGESFVSGSYSFFGETVDPKDMIEMPNVFYVDNLEIFESDITVQEFVTFSVAEFANSEYAQELLSDTGLDSIADIRLNLLTTLQKCLLYILCASASSFIDAIIINIPDISCVARDAAVTEKVLNFARAAGKTVLTSGFDLSFAAGFATYLVVLKNGSAVFTGGVRDFCASYSPAIMHVNTPNAARLAEKLAAPFPKLEFRPTANGLSIFNPNRAPVQFAKLTGTLSAYGVKDNEIKPAALSFGSAWKEAFRNV